MWQPHDVRGHDRRVVVDREGDAVVDGGLDGAGMGCACFPEAPAVPVAPEKGVRGVVRGNEAQRLDGGKLVRTHQLRVDDHGAVVRQGGRVDGLRDTLDRRIDGGIAVGVHEHRRAALDHPGDAFPVGLDVVCGIGDVVRRRVLGALGVGLGQPGGAALRGAVENELHPADTETAVVGAVVTNAGDRLVVEGVDHRISDEVDGEGLALSRGTHRRDVRQDGASVLHGGDAEARVVVERAAQESFVAVRPDPAELPQGEGHGGGFLHHAVGLVAVRASANHAARGIRRVAVDAHCGQCR